MKVINEALLESFRNAEACEYCGKKLRFKAEAAHIFARGMGGGSRLDVRINLVSLGGPWDCACHHNNHHGGNPTREELMEVAARRERTTAEKVELAIYALKRAPKGSDCLTILRQFVE